jgi:hypothetical protein
MKVRAGVVGATALLLAFSCSKSDKPESSHRTDVGGASGTGAAGTAGGATAGGSAEAAGVGGMANGAAGSAATAGGATAGSGASAGASAVSPGVGGTAGGGAGASNGGEAGAAGSGGLAPAALFVMFDRSWLMNECGDGTATIEMSNSIMCPSGVTRWQVMTQAFKTLIADPATAGLNVALRFFPDDKPTAGCAGYADAAFDGGVPDAGLPSCDLGACSRPLVEPARLTAESTPGDAQEAALVAAVDSSQPPPGDTMPNPNPMAPTFAAVGGAEQWAASYASAHPGEPTFVLLVTNGAPHGCDEDSADIANLAASANTGAGILTFVVGLPGQNEQVLNRIAQAGGTKESYLVEEGSNAVKLLLAALADARRSTP